MNDYAEVLEAELPRLMHEVMLGVLGDEPENDVAVADFGSPLACRVTIRGSFEGEVVVSMHLALASCVAQHMFADELPGSPTQQDALDALREVSNIVAGNLKPLFGEHNQLGLPEDLTPSEADARVGQLAQAKFAHPCGVLDVRVYASL